MAITGGNWTGGNPPKNFAHPPAPKPLTAVAGAPALKGGNLLTNRAVGTPVAEPVTIEVDGQNLVDLIASLTERIATLEGA